MLAALALSQWASVAPAKPLATGAAWIEYMVRAIMVARSWSTDLSIAYYQLSRSLDIGYSFGAPLEGSLELDDMRNTFRSMVEFIMDLEDSDGIYGGNEDALWLMSEMGSLSSKERELIPPADNLADLLNDLTNNSTGSGTVSYDDFQWPSDMTEDQVMDAFGSILRDKALELQQKRYAQSRNDPTLDLFEEFRKSGSSGAGVVDFAVLSGGRNAIDRATRSDRKIKLVARRTSSNPCAFCAMLASRGWVYVNVNQAGVPTDDRGTDDIRKYHFNCHCTQDVRWITTAEASEMNKYLGDKWREVVQRDSEDRGYTKSWGPDLNAFRRWMRKEHPNGFTEFSK